MAQIRGGRGKRPCPICLVPKENLSDVSTTWPLKTVKHTKQIIDQANTLNTKEGEKLLSAFGIHNVDMSIILLQSCGCITVYDIQNVFWLLKNLDPHHALSFDRLHSNHSGLFGYHLWDLFKAVVNQIGCDVATKVDLQYDS